MQNDLRDEGAARARGYAAPNPPPQPAGLRLHGRGLRRPPRPRAPPPAGPVSNARQGLRLPGLRWRELRTGAPAGSGTPPDLGSPLAYPEFLSARRLAQGAPRPGKARDDSTFPALRPNDEENDGERTLRPAASAQIARGRGRGSPRPGRRRGPAPGQIGEITSQTGRRGSTRDCAAQATRCGSPAGLMPKAPSAKVVSRARSPDGEGVPGRAGPRPRPSPGRHGSGITTGAAQPRRFPPRATSSHRPAPGFQPAATGRGTRRQGGSPPAGAGCYSGADRGRRMPTAAGRWPAFLGISGAHACWALESSGANRENASEGERPPALQPLDRAGEPEAGERGQRRGSPELCWASASPGQALLWSLSRVGFC